MKLKLMKNMEENMSNLTSSVSNEASVSSTSRNDILTPLPSHSIKKKRNQPGHPDPSAEVIALSPKTLLATNRFVCEICNKGFQRDQNLQLHRRGHNLPWKLKQRANKEAVRKKVYVCPETKCVHHEPSRALGDLTGIKKHFSRKHGEKKFKCQKCSKKYAVQSDWKAHSKICGTREYRCDCGTLFSRRDSFITHRAFCDALGQENARKTNIIPIIQSPTGNSKISNSVSSHQTNPSQIQIQPQFSHISNESPFEIKQEHQNNNFTLRSEMPPWLSPPPTIGPFPGGPPVQPVDCTAPPPPPPQAPSIFQDFHHPNPNPSSGTTGPTVLPSPVGGLIIRPYHSHVPSDFGLDLSARDGLIDNALACYGNNIKADHAVMTRGGGGSTVVTGAPAGEISSRLPSASSSSSFIFHGFDGLEFEESLKFEAAIDQFSNRNDNEGIGGNSDGMTTRDFLGLREGDIFSLSSYMNEQINQVNKSWQG